MCYYLPEEAILPTYLVIVYISLVTAIQAFLLKFNFHKTTEYMKAKMWKLLCRHQQT